MKRYVHGLAMFLAFAATANAQQAAEHKQAKIDKDDPGIISALGLDTCFTSGSGMVSMKVCITNNGNISWFEAPLGSVHIKTREGYAVCSSIGGVMIVHGYDVNIAAEGWGPPTVSDNKRVITRISLDGMLQLKQTFTLVPTGPGVDVKMELKNLSPVVIHDFVIARHFDGDIDNTPENVYQKNNNSVWGLESNGLMLSPVPSNSVHFLPKATTYADWNPQGTGWKVGTGCWTSSSPTAVNADYVGGIVAGSGELKPGQTKSLTLHYRKF
jgi:hypothetical protein